jgi:glycosyltransferase involved in cell wall biosynthesis
VAAAKLKRRGAMSEIDTPPIAEEPGPPDQESPYISIIIPAFNEEKRLGQSLQEVAGYCDTLPYPVELIVVDDGSDDRTVEIVKEQMQECDYLRLHSSPHGGKGHACKQGVKVARGQWLLLCDADLAVPIRAIASFEPLLASGAEIVIASREVAGAERVGEPEHRHFMGRIFNWVVRALAVRGIADTQCGFKCFRKNVAQELIERQTIAGWGFDVELLLIARRRGYKIEEVPITWYYGEQSKINPLQDSIRMFREVLQIRINAWRGRYD